MNFRHTRMLKYTGWVVLLPLTVCNGWIVRSANNFSKPTSQSHTRRLDSWLDFDFDATSPMGSAKNPAVILPPNLAALLGNPAGAKRVGDMMFIPAAEFQKAANQPMAAILLTPVLGQLSNVKSFDDFSAVDMTGLIKNLPSELSEPMDAAARRASGQDPDLIRKLLRNGDLVFGAHVVNYMTWGRYNHVAIVIDAERGILAESTAHLPTDQPGVRTIEWKSFAAGYAHMGVVRVKGASGDQLARVVRWLEERKGRPYRWPIIQGLDKTDQSRFYCSQLAWLAYKEVLNLDLDVDKGALVFPDDLYYSKDFVEVIVP